MQNHQTTNHKSDTYAKQIICQISEYNQKMYEYGKNVRTYGTQQELRIDQTHLIDFVGDNPNCRLCDIAAAMDMNVSTISLQVKRMIKLGLLTKKRSEQNQREIVLSLTQDGQSVFEYHKTLDERWASAFTNRLSSFTLTELDTIQRFMSILLDDHSMNI